jgi:hypothetical protein
MQAKYDAKNPAALKRLVAGGAKLHVFDKSILKAAHDAAMALYDDLSAKNPNWKKVYSDYAAFRDEQHLWFRFAEAGFDNFMQTGRSGLPVLTTNPAAAGFVFLAALQVRTESSGAVGDAQFGARRQSEVVSAARAVCKGSLLSLARG